MNKIFIVECNSNQCATNFHKILATFKNAAELTPRRYAIITSEDADKVKKRFKQPELTCNVTITIIYAEDNEGKRIL